MKKLSDVVKLIVCVGICLLVGVIGSFFTTPSIPTWYAGLVKPVFNPPNWVFGPVWTALYIMMGVSAWLVLKKCKEDQNAKAALVIFGIQLLLNGIWSPVFFGLKSALGGLIVIVVLLIMIAKTILVFWRISKTSALLLVPYILWVAFATVLNFYLWRLN